MKKKLVSIALSLCCAGCMAVSFTACDLFGGSKHEHDYDTAWSTSNTHHWYQCGGAGKCDAPEKDKAAHVDSNKDERCDVCSYPMPVPQEAPVEIDYDYTDTRITVKNAYYGTDRTTSFDTEYRLDNGEWQKRTYADYLYYENLAPASAHTLSARMSAQNGKEASEPFTVTVTMKKSPNLSAPLKNEVSYEITGKKVVFTLNEGIELSLDGTTYSAQSTITHVYPESGFKTVYIRYAETATHTASGRQSVQIRVTDFAGGKGTEEAPYLIGTLQEFKALKSFTEDGSYFALTADIAFDSEVWAQNYLSEIHLDGRGHKLTGLKQKTPLFYGVSSVKDLTVENAEYITKIAEQGELDIPNPAILAKDLNYAENVSVSGLITVSAPNNAVSLSYDYSLAVGGICGRLVQEEAGEEYGMTGCRADITVSLPNIEEKMGNHMKLNMGGLAGIVLPNQITAHNELAAISRCSANLNVTQAYVFEANIGGLLGGLGSVGQYGTKFGPTANISNCYTTGDVHINFYAKNVASHSGTLRIGGIAPEITGSISKCYSAIDFDIETELYTGYSAGIYLGGICASAHDETGFDEQILSNCFFAGSIQVTNTATENAGGTYNLNALCADARSFHSTGSLYYLNTVVSAVTGNESVSALDGASAVTNSVLKSSGWQKDTVGLSNTVWVIEDGKLPVLK